MRRPPSRQRTWSCAVLLLAFVLSIGTSCGAARADREIPEKMKGISWEASGPIDREDLLPLRSLGANWISQTPFGWVVSLTDPTVHLETERVLWGERDSGLVETVAHARELGLRTLLKPHLWVRRGEWPGDIEMESEEAWRAWFASYEEFLLHYARLAEESGMEALAVGTELRIASRRTDDWRALIARTREVYHGPLTYCANWYDEAERIEFWKDLDFIGVQAYYPLSDSTRPSYERLKSAWIPVESRLSDLSRRTGRKVVFTEIGYKSVEGSLASPWHWGTEGAYDPDIQRDGYRAMFETFWGKPWFGGTFIWKWHSRPRSGHRVRKDFTPQGKPALEVIREYYRR